jgi:2-phosphosulfolactate phosphatase
VRLDVAFLPEEAGTLRGRVAVVVDVLRATTSLLTVLERGCAEVLIAPTVEAARRFGRRHPGMLLAGEERGRAPAGFNFGNSPVAFARAELEGRRMVFSTTNGTRAIRLAQSASTILLGCLRNSSAVARGGLAAAGGDDEVCVVCAGREGQFSLDDAYTAGAIVDALLAEAGGNRLVLTDAALAAQALYRSTADAAGLFRRTRAGRNVMEIGLSEDLDYCAQRDTSVLVPEVGDRVRVAGW